MSRHHGGAGWRGLARKALTLLMAAGTGLAPVEPAFAQRRKGEPEANPDFQNQAQPGGAPVTEGTELQPPAAGGAPAPEPVREEATAPGGGMGVQIGATPARKPSASAPGTPLDTRVTVRVKGAPLATFLDTISAQAKVNFIITEGLEAKRVTAFLQNVTVREALQVLLEIKGLTYQQIGKSNTYVVAPRSKTVENLITRIYTLSYIPLIAIGTLASEQAANNPDSGGSSGAGGMGGMMGLGMPGSAPIPGGATGPQESGVSIINVLRSVLSKLGQVAIEPRTNALVVTDIPETFPQVEQIIAELDKKAPQVMIEAQIVEIDSNRARDLGFEWGGTNGELGKFSAGARDTRFPLDMPNNLSKVRVFDPVNNVISALGESKKDETPSTADTFIVGSSLQTGLVDLTSLKVSLRALVSRSEARFLGKPKILTLNNKSALIEVVQREAISLQSQSTSIGTAGSQNTVEPKREDTGLILRVTPQVNKEGYITMLIQPSFTNVKEANISTANNRIFDTVKRKASTLVRIRNAQTLVLGGLLQSTETKIVRKVPLLGYIPIIGWFFTSSSTRRSNSDLVIFITPTIVSD